MLRCERTGCCALYVSFRVCGFCGVDGVEGELGILGENGTGTAFLSNLLAFWAHASVFASSA
jgi:hypothetical protein